MSGSGATGVLSGATRQLWARWAETRDSWRDRKAEEFEESYLADLRSRVDSSIRAIEELEQLLNKVHADCD